MKRIMFSLLAVASFALSGLAQEDGYTSLFNGKDLTGWKYGDVPPKKKPPTEVLDGKTASSDKHSTGRLLLITSSILLAGCTKAGCRQTCRGRLTPKRLSTSYFTDQRHCYLLKLRVGIRRIVPFLAIRQEERPFARNPVAVVDEMVGSS